jgi:hypothetical protein
MEPKSRMTDGIRCATCGAEPSAGVHCDKCFQDIVKVWGEAESRLAQINKLLDDAGFPLRDLPLVERVQHLTYCWLDGDGTAGTGT